MPTDISHIPGTGSKHRTSDIGRPGPNSGLMPYVMCGQRPARSYQGAKGVKPLGCEPEQS
jgi:hypothetical protein